MTDDTARAIRHAASKVSEGMYAPDTRTPAAVRAAAEAGDVRVLLDLWSTLCPEECRKTSNRRTLDYYHMPGGALIKERTIALWTSSGRLLWPADSIQCAVQAACLSRGWTWGVGTANSTEHGYNGPAVGACGDGWDVDMRTTEHAPAVSLLAAYLLALLATRDDA